MRGERVAQFMRMNMAVHTLFHAPFGKERKVPIGRTAVTWLEHWLERRGLFNPQDDAMFLSSKGSRISARNVQKRFAEWGGRVCQVQ